MILAITRASMVAARKSGCGMSAPRYSAWPRKLLEVLADLAELEEQGLAGDGRKGSGAVIEESLDALECGCEPVGQPAGLIGEAGEAVEFAAKVRRWRSRPP